MLAIAKRSTLEEACLLSHPWVGTVTANVELAESRLIALVSCGSTTPSMSSPNA